MNASLPDKPEQDDVNPLWDYFQNHETGQGVWKWEHYFDIYHRHFHKFIDQEVRVLEIGVYSGGSLEMWRSYFGDKSKIYGVDIEEACKVYENDHTSILIGDQADRSFWQTFKQEHEPIDILIDDGGHTPKQQGVTLELLLPHIRPGGIYLCEDVHGKDNPFAEHAKNVINQLNDFHLTSLNPHFARVNPFQSVFHSIHFYPYVIVIEKHKTPSTAFSAPKKGTQWQPFFV